MDERVLRRTRVDLVDAVREWTAPLATQEDIEAVERGRAQIAAGQWHDMDDVIEELENIVRQDRN